MGTEYPSDSLSRSTQQLKCSSLFLRYGRRVLDIHGSWRRMTSPHGASNSLLATAAGDHAWPVTPKELGTTATLHKQLDPAQDARTDSVNVPLSGSNARIIPERHHREGKRKINLRAMALRHKPLSREALSPAARCP